MGFEPTLGYKPKHAFQACALNHSATSPLRHLPRLMPRGFLDKRRLTHMQARAISIETLLAQ